MGGWVSTYPFLSLLFPISYLFTSPLLTRKKTLKACREGGQRSFSPVPTFPLPLPVWERKGARGKVRGARRARQYRR